MPTSGTWHTRLVADRDSGRRPPGGNYIPNGDGDGSQVISSGNPGGY